MQEKFFLLQLRLLDTHFFPVLNKCNQKSFIRNQDLQGY
jgi:hypothetical protein